MELLEITASYASCNKIDFASVQSHRSNLDQLRIQILHQRSQWANINGIIVETQLMLKPAFSSPHVKHYSIRKISECDSCPIRQKVSGSQVSGCLPIRSDRRSAVSPPLGSGRGRAVSHPKIHHS